MCNELIHNKKTIEKRKNIKEESDFVFSGNYENFNRKKWSQDLSKQNICHHCKILFPKKILIKCQNDSVIKCQINEKESKIDS